MCFSDYFSIQNIEKDTEKDPIKDAWVLDNEKQYKEIKKIITTLDTYKKEPVNVNTKFTELFAVYNIANVFSKDSLKHHLDDVINQRFITNEKLKILLMEYIHIYENYNDD